MDNDLKWLPILDIVPVQSGEGTLSFMIIQTSVLWRWTMIIRKSHMCLLFLAGLPISKRKQDVIWCIWIGRKITILLRYWRTLRTRKCMCMESGLEIMG